MEDIDASRLKEGLLEEERSSVKLKPMTTTSKILGTDKIETLQAESK